MRLVKERECQFTAQLMLGAKSMFWIVVLQRQGYMLNMEYLQFFPICKIGDVGRAATIEDRDGLAVRLRIQAGWGGWADF